MNTSLPLVHIIVITFNGKRHLEYCFRALARTTYGNYQVMLADNGSVDGAPEYVEANFPACRVVRNGANLGFAGGNNAAIRVSLSEHAEYIVLLNDDTAVLDPEWLSRAVTVAEANSSIGMLGFEIVNGKGEYDPSLDVQHTSSSIALSYVPRIEGCALFMRASVLQQIGLLDEIYFMYAEEDDLEMRAIRAGYKLGSINSAIYHAGGATSKKYPATISYYEARNYLRFGLKNLGPFYAVRRFLTLFDILCNPFPLVHRKENAAHVRMRSSGPLTTNFVIYCRAVFWNLAHLAETLSLRFARPKLVTE
ncbi:MAG TPA: glycosyltransferase family 2 protein [Bryobacteraceae bacterium]|jgi:hypothetical protein|nr:glycosyltransferase family 2 protein [Bryobacteraceae bacterium]